MKLNDLRARNAKPKEKPYRMNDGHGLHLYVPVTGNRVWRMRYKHGGRENILTFGPYPEVSLAEAREQREEARASIRAGRDPAADRRLKRLALEHQDHKFEAIARNWHTLQLDRWTERHASDVLDSLTDYVFPDIGKLPITQIDAPTVLAILRKIEKRPALETARRVRQRMSAIFVYAIATGVGVADPAAVVQSAMAPIKKGRQPAVTDLEESRKMLRAAESIPAHPVTRLGLRMISLTAVRPSELRGARWDEFEGIGTDSPIWRVPADRMKMKVEHIVPLSRQAVAVIETVRQISGRYPMVFPNHRHAHLPLSENAIGYLLNRAGYHGRHVPHGWRATFSTVMNERFHADRSVIDLMLAHAPKDKVERAYNRAQLHERRRELAQIWSDLLLDGFDEPETFLAMVRR